MNVFIINGIQVESLDKAVEALFRTAQSDLGLGDVTTLTDGEKRALVIHVVNAGGLNFRNCVRDLAKLLRVSRTTIYKVINGKTTPAVRGNRKTRNGF